MSHQAQGWLLNQLEDLTTADRVACGRLSRWFTDLTSLGHREQRREILGATLCRQRPYIKPFSSQRKVRAHVGQRRG